MTFATPLDTGFPKRKLSSSENPMTAKQGIEFTKTIGQRIELEDYTQHRIYYYDAEPMFGKRPIPLTGSSGNWSKYDFSTTAVHNANNQLLTDLKKVPFIAVRLGEVNFRGWLVEPNNMKPGGNRTSLTIQSGNLIPNVQQKGVNLRLEMDIAALALKHHVDIIVLVISDSDFVPAPKFARREGKQVCLYTLGHEVISDLYTHRHVN